jgi:hypothetical protein
VFDLVEGAFVVACEIGHHGPGGDPGQERRDIEPDRQACGQEHGSERLGLERFAR